MSTKGFKPIMVSFNEKEYNRHQDLAQKKLELLDEASVWVHNQIELEKKINLKRLHINMVEYFKDAILEVYKDRNQLGLSAVKLIDAKEIPIGDLIQIQVKYNALDVEVYFEQNVAKVKVDRKDFETWTRNEKQNNRVIAANKFIQSLQGLLKHTKVYPANIQSGTSEFIRYDIEASRYVVNPTYIFS